MYQDVIDEATASGMTSNTSPEFQAILDEMETLLNDYTQQYDNFYQSYIDQDTRVVYDLGSIYTVEGGYSIVVTGLVSGVIGLIVSIVVVFIKDSEITKKTLTDE